MKLYKMEVGNGKGGTDIHYHIQWEERELEKANIISKLDYDDLNTLVNYIKVRDQLGRKPIV